jgi:hypothetical protein
MHALSSVVVALEPWSSVETRHLVGTAVCAGLIVALLVGGDPGWTPVFDSANLVFHEAGHKIYGILGDTFALYGGLLGQLTFPIAVVIIFFVRREAPGVAVGVIWIGQNLMSIARYMADARAKELPLVGGTEHDFEHIFLRWDVLGRDVEIAGYTRTLGWIAMLGALGWLAWRWHRDRKVTPS